MGKKLDVPELATFITAYPLLIETLLALKLDGPATAKYQSCDRLQLATFITAHPLLFVRPSWRRSLTVLRRTSTRVVSASSWPPSSQLTRC